MWQQNMEKITFTGKNFNDTTLRTRKEAERLEEKIAKKYRDKGFTVWSDKLPFIED